MSFSETAEQATKYFGSVPVDLKLDSKAIAPNVILEIHQSIDSTNTRVKQILDAGFDHAVHMAKPFNTEQAQLMVVVCADHQSAGRGRFYKKWISPPGQNIYATFGFCCPELTDLSGLSLAIGLSLQRLLLSTLQQQGISAAVTVKWPNDVLIDGAKVAGILIEAFQKNGQWWVVAGVGLNVHMTTLEPMDLPYPWTSLELQAVAIHRGEFLKSMAAKLQSSFVNFVAFGWAHFAQEWQAADWFYGQALETADIHGIGMGVDRSGQLLIQDAQGQLHSLVSGEVRLRSGKF